MKKFALIAASLAVLASPVFAADEHKTTGTAPAEAKFSTVSKDEMFSSKIKGLSVTNQKNETVGDISGYRDEKPVGRRADPFGRRLPRHGRALCRGVAIVSQGSYDQKNDKWLASMNTTKDALKAAPEFKYPK